MQGKEPSLLDYLRSIFQGNPEQYSIYLQGVEKPEEPEKSCLQSSEKNQAVSHAYLIILALLLAMSGQYFLEPVRRLVGMGVFLYFAAVTGMVLFFWKNKDTFSPLSEKVQTWQVSQEVRIGFLFPATILLAAAFWFFQDNRFTLLNVSLWLAGIIFFVLAVWEKPQAVHKTKFKATPFLILVVLIALLSIFFRVYELQAVPSQMFSDHAEKLLDVADVLDGKTSIFFTRNTGREPLQFYLTALIIKIFNTGISFLSLKIGTVLAGLLTLPFIYLTGKELGGKWVGLAALFFTGVGYWPNVISRVALRYAFYPLFTAATLYYLIKGLRTRNRNDFLLAGLLLGVGLNGYSSTRFLPIVVSVFFLIYFFELKTKPERQQLVWMFLLVAVAAFFVFLPLFRYWIENPALFSYRAATRLLPIEQPYPGNPLLIFLQNLWKAMTMFFYDNGEIWVHSVPNRPALDVVSAAFYFVGNIFCLVKAVRQKNWLAKAIIISIPLLLISSILSLVFPSENPSLNRPGGGYVPVFVLAGYGLVRSMQIILQAQSGKIWKYAVGGLCVLLAAICGLQNYDLVFHEYKEQFDLKAWNTTEIAEEIQRFCAEGGNIDNAFVVPYPYWVDTRLVGINAGLPRKDYALWVEDFSEATADSGTYLFILKPEDDQDIALVQKMFPANSIFEYHSDIPGKDFIEIRVNK
ncbi:MAG: glycosyltransferase family 39 protein [Chloroflexi bacterium]|nr:glycosyltransferase family 39 protein [Chloroflexota bacterium]